MKPTEIKKDKLKKEVLELIRDYLYKETGITVHEHCQEFGAQCLALLIVDKCVEGLK